jgi:hypothetical protein
MMERTGLHRVGAALFAVAMSAIAHPAAADGWSLRVSTDAMTDKEHRVAVTENAQGHRLSVYRLESGAVWMNFAVSDGSLDLISSDKLIDYRVDKREPVRLQDAAKVRHLGIIMSEWEPKWVNFQIWHGKENEGRNGIAQLLEGETFTVRYYLATGGYKDTRFSLVGAAPVMAEAIGISVEPDPGVAARADRIASARRRHIEQCPKDHPRATSQCILTLKACDAHSADASAFERCVEGLAGR